MYRAFGLKIDCEFPFPELEASPDGGDPDVMIEYGKVAPLSDALAKGEDYEAAPGRILFRVNGVAAFLISEGRSITVELESGPAAGSARRVILGTVFGILLHQRGLLALHASTVLTDQGCVSFMGASGAGKSTLAAALSQWNSTVFADDVTALRSGDAGLSLALPGYPHLKLWADSLEMLDYNKLLLPRVCPSREKRYVPLDRRFCFEARPLKFLFVLSVGENNSISSEPLKGPEALSYLRKHTLWPRYLAGSDIHLRHFRQYKTIIEQVPIIRLRRSPSCFRLKELTGCVQDYISGRKEACVAV